MTVKGKRDTYQIALLAEGIALHSVEGLSTKFIVALEAGETLNVVYYTGKKKMKASSN